MRALGTKGGDQTLLAIAYTNLGNVYQVRGDLVQAEALFRKALELNEALGRKEGMAIAYGNLWASCIRSGETSPRPRPCTSKP